MTSLELLAARVAAFALVVALSVAGGFYWGHSSAADACAAKAGKATAKVEKAEDKRDENIDAIAAATAGAVAAAMNDNRAESNESTDRIRTVVVPGPCRAVDPDILRELRAAADDANAALGIRVRPVPSGPGAAGPGSAPVP